MLPGSLAPGFSGLLGLKLVNYHQQDLLAQCRGLELFRSSPVVPQRESLGQSRFFRTMETNCFDMSPPTPSCYLKETLYSSCASYMVPL